MSDTHDGAFFGIPPTGRRLAVRQAHMLRLHDGLIREHWAVRDDLGVLVQLGAVEPLTPSCATDAEGAPIGCSKPGRRSSQRDARSVRCLWANGFGFRLADLDRRWFGGALTRPSCERMTGDGQHTPGDGRV